MPRLRADPWREIRREGAPVGNPPTDALRVRRYEHAAHKRYHPVGAALRVRLLTRLVVVVHSDGRTLAEATERDLLNAVAGYRADPKERRKLTLHLYGTLAWLHAHGDLPAPPPRLAPAIRRRRTAWTKSETLSRTTSPRGLESSALLPPDANGAGSNPGSFTSGPEAAPRERPTPPTQPPSSPRWAASGAMRNATASLEPSGGSTTSSPPPASPRQIPGATRLHTPTGRDTRPSAPTERVTADFAPRLPGPCPAVAPAVAQARACLALLEREGAPDPVRADLADFGVWLALAGQTLAGADPEVGRAFVAGRYREALRESRLRALGRWLDRCRDCGILPATPAWHKPRPIRPRKPRPMGRRARTDAVERTLPPADADLLARCVSTLRAHYRRPGNRSESVQTVREFAVWLQDQGRHLAAFRPTDIRAYAEATALKPGAHFYERRAKILRLALAVCQRAELLPSGPETWLSGRHRPPWAK